MTAKAYESNCRPMQSSVKGGNSRGFHAAPTQQLRLSEGQDGQARSHSICSLSDSISVAQRLRSCCVNTANSFGRMRFTSMPTCFIRSPNALLANKIELETQLLEYLHRSRRRCVE